ncbi:MAG: hypothetical protein ACREBG_26505 [Pyrinomonadaceae bacterium]
MKATDHNKILGFLHLAYGGLTVLLMTVLSIFMLGVMGALAANESRGEELPIGIFAAILIFVVLIDLLQITTSFLSGYALLKRRRWAKTMGIMSGIVAGFSFPLGSALCVYTLWFLFGEKGRVLYHKGAYELPPAPKRWGRAARGLHEPEYVPPKTPPNWR